MAEAQPAPSRRRRGKAMVQSEKEVSEPWMRIEEFEKHGRIGKGGFSNVYHATDNQTGLEYAIKECYKQELIRNNAIHFVLRERRILCRLDHKYIIKLHYAFQDEFTLYFVLDYMPRGSIANQLQKWHHFRNDVTRFYTAEVIVALEYLRNEACVHRDIKSDNILLDANYHIKLTDFGTSVQLDIPWTVQNVLEDDEVLEAKKNSLVGTSIYCSPEIVNAQDVTYSTDLWSLGCMLFEFHTGTFAFPTSNYRLGPVFDRISKAQFAEFPQGSDPELINLVNRLLVVDPNRRLGCDSFEGLKRHPFYGGLPQDWNLLSTLNPPPFNPMDENRPPGDPNRPVSDICPPYLQPPRWLDWDNLDSD